MIELLKNSGGKSYLDIYSGTVTGTPTASIDPFGDVLTPTPLTVSAGTAPAGVSQRWVADIPDEPDVFGLNSPATQPCAVPRQLIDIRFAAAVAVARSPTNVVRCS